MGSSIRRIVDIFAEAKGESGLDEYEIRKRDVWHRHISLCLLAHAYLVVHFVAEHEDIAILITDKQDGLWATGTVPRTC